ncbi:MAG: M23 family metallopeptidase [Candidatus Uhrbacteria bacterium]
MQRKLNYWLIFVLFILIGCGHSYLEPDNGGMGGSVDLPAGVWHLPFAQGEYYKCTQGANGNYSHNGSSTLYGLDFDTSNTHNQDLFAPASGTAFVHWDTSPYGFGYHLNIDVGDGYYLVIGHMADIFVEDGVEVAEGQFIGFEGCTGNCTGDHVHLDLHTGDPRQMAQYGNSVLTEYYVRDITAGTDETYLAGDQFVCDLSTGHDYESMLAVTGWHPDGTLLKYPDSTEVFVVDQGEIWWIENEEVFYSYGFDFSDVVPMSEHELWCWQESAGVLSQPTEYQAVEDQDGFVWLAYEPVSSAGRYRQQVPSDLVPEILNSWGVCLIHSTVDQNGQDILNNYPAYSGKARFRDGTLVQETGSSAVYVVNDGTALPIKNWQTYLMLGFEHRFIFEVPAGTLDLGVLGVGSCEVDIGCLDQTVVSSCGTMINFDLGGSDNPGPIGDDDDSEPSHGDDDDTVSDDDDVVSDDDDDVISDDDDDDTVLSDDDDVVSDDDDDDTVLSDDDDVLSDDDDNDTYEQPGWLLLEIEALLNGAPPDYFWLQGELLDENDSPAGGGFWWSSLEYLENNNQIYWSAYVLSDWSFRYSLEYERYGAVSWSCLAPYPPGTITMDLDAYVDGTSVAVQAIDNHLGGCELLVEVP